MTGAGQGALQQSTPNWRGTALQYPQEAKKVVWGRGGAGNLKKNNEHITGCGIFANRVPRFPLFPPSTRPLDDNNSFIWISQSCGKKKMGTMAGTRVLCTQYLLRVAIYIFTEVSIILPHRSSLLTLADQATWIHSWPLMACRPSDNKHYI